MMRYRQFLILRHAVIVMQIFLMLVLKDNVNVTNVQFDMDRFIADSNVSLHYVNLIVNVHVLPLDSLIDIDNPNDTKVSELADKQCADETLSGAFEFAKLSKGGYFLKNGILFHRTKILDNFVERLVVPKRRRRALLELAHDKLGCHLRVRRTKDHIGLSFMWPMMINDVVDYCRSCEVCQKRAPITYRDRVPIEGSVVSVEPVFSHFYVDALAPLLSVP